MTRAIIPTVVVEDVPVPHWACSAVRRAKNRLRQPDCVMVVRYHSNTPWALPTPEPWGTAAFCVDGVSIGVVFADGAVREFATGLAAGRRTITIQPMTGTTTFQPIALKIARGTVVLLDGYPRDYDKGRALPSATFRILPHGLAHNGRWGERWSRRLGWNDPADPDRLLEGQ